VIIIKTYEYVFRARALYNGRQLKSTTIIVGTTFASTLIISAARDDGRAGLPFNARVYNRFSRSYGNSTPYAVVAAAAAATCIVRDRSDVAKNENVT